MKSEFSSLMGLLTWADVPCSVPNTNRANPRKVLLSEILIMTTYPPVECGIATYSQDLKRALNNKYKESFAVKICALESGESNIQYPREVKYVLDTRFAKNFALLAKTINADANISIVMIQHEFGLFQNEGHAALSTFISTVKRPVVLVFHTVLPLPEASKKLYVQNIISQCKAIVVMTKNAAQILVRDYFIAPEKVHVIEHGIHLVSHLGKQGLKEKYNLTNRTILSTFGLLGEGKSIETTLDAMPAFIATHPDILFLVIGKTHPSLVKTEGERYRAMLQTKIGLLNLQNHVLFINEYLPLPQLLEYLQLSDIYLFTSKDPNQAVSGTFAYAMSCGCPIITTPIPHAKEVLQDGMGIIIDFNDSSQLSTAVLRILDNKVLRDKFVANTLLRILPSSWENSAIAHARLLQAITCKAIEAETKGKENAPWSAGLINLKFRVPELNLDHIKKMTTPFGMIQFAKFNRPDIASGYTLDDNARALVAICAHYEQFGSSDDIATMEVYLNFIAYCQLADGSFYNYVDITQHYTAQNTETNLSDSNGRAIWALGYFISKKDILPKDLIIAAERILLISLNTIMGIYSPRAMAFIIKGLYLYNTVAISYAISRLITVFANRLLQMYKHEQQAGWQWYESYMTYGNSILPEAMLCAYLDTEDAEYADAAKQTFDFLLSVTFKENSIRVVSNKGWHHRGRNTVATPIGGEQPIDVAYTILALDRFYKTFEIPHYKEKMMQSFNWFLGENHLHQIIYNPCTGGCFDGLEEESVNMNQGAESTVSYLMARLTIEYYLETPLHIQAKQSFSFKQIN